MTLTEAHDGGGWYACTMELQLASLQFCIECRSAPTLFVQAEESTSPTLLPPNVPNQGQSGCPRVLTVGSSTFCPLEIRPSGRFGSGSLEFAGLQSLMFGVIFDDPSPDLYGWHPCNS